MLTKEQWNNVIELFKSEGFPFLSFCKCSKCGEWYFLGKDSSVSQGSSYSHPTYQLEEWIVDRVTHGDFLLKIICPNCNGDILQSWESEVLNWLNNK